MIKWKINIIKIKTLKNKIKTTIPHKKKNHFLNNISDCNIKSYVMRIYQDLRTCIINNMVPDVDN